MKSFTENIDWKKAANYIDQYDLNVNALGLSEAIQKGHQDAFSKCQLYTKFKIAEYALPIIQKHSSSLVYDDNTVIICGSWIGIMSVVLNSYYQQIGLPIRYTISNYDLDPEAIHICQTMLGNHSNCYSWVEDIHKIKTYNDSMFIINPIIEHIPSTKNWLECLPKKVPIIMTSTNYEKPEDHVNLSTSMDDFISQCEGLINIDTTVILRFPIYERYIIIGST